MTVMIVTIETSNIRRQKFAGFLPSVLDFMLRNVAANN